MAALLPNCVLRQHALPSAFIADLDRVEALAPVAPVNRMTSAARLRPVASWHVGGDGRPLCRWTMDEPSTLDLSPS
jgi:hypothetical protein